MMRKKDLNEWRELALLAEILANVEAMNDRIARRL
jgi:hypothetical protein